MYKRVNIESAPNIIGVKNGIYQVELLEKKSFASKEEQEYYNVFFDRDIDRMLLNSFRSIDNTKLSKIIYYPLKNAKETDFIGYAPYELGIDFIVSEQCLSLLKTFKLSNYNKIKVSVEGFSNNYYAIGFPMLPNNSVDYIKSTFINLVTKEDIKIINQEDYRNQKFVGNKEIIIKENISFDAIGIQGFGLYFSQKLIDAVKNSRLTGLQIQNTEMNCSSADTSS